MAERGGAERDPKGRAGASALAWLAGCALLMGVVAARAEEAGAPSTRRWDVTAAPYLWAARLDGDAEVRGIEADVDVSFQDTLENLGIAGMAIVEARQGRFGFAFNPLYVRTNADARTGPLDARNETDIATAGVGVFYRAAEWEIGRTDAGEPRTLAVEPLVGARLMHLRSEIDIKLDAGGFRERRQVDESQTWVDPLVGVNVIARLAERWAVRAEADIGGFGLGSDLTWNVQAILSYRWTVGGYDVLAGVGYRALYWDYRDGGFAWDVTMSGPMLGAAIRF
jgi:hypothetical protein